jgi:lycopene cyclase domain-containing protein
MRYQFLLSVLIKRRNKKYEPMNKFEYLIVNLLVLVPTFILATFFSKNPITKNYTKAVLISLLIPALFFISWDIYATFAHHWDFNPKFVTGFYIFNLPFEEIFFFFSIPFACLFVWGEFKYFTSWADYWSHWGKFIGIKKF